MAPEEVPLHTLSGGHGRLSGSRGCRWHHAIQTVSMDLKEELTLFEVSPIQVHRAEVVKLC